MHAPRSIKLPINDSFQGDATDRVLQVPADSDVSSVASPSSEAKRSEAKPSESKAVC